MTIITTGGPPCASTDAPAADTTPGGGQAAGQSELERLVQRIRALGEDHYVVVTFHESFWVERGEHSVLVDCYGFEFRADTLDDAVRLCHEQLDAWEE